MGIVVEGLALQAVDAFVGIDLAGRMNRLHRTALLADPAFPAALGMPLQPPEHAKLGWCPPVLGYDYVLLLAEERARKRSELLAATEELLAPITAAVNQGRLVGADRIGLRVGKIIDKYKMAKHLHLSITDTSLTITRKTSQIAAEAALDGIYVLRTSVPAATLDAAGVVTAYKSLAKVERDFRSLKVDDLDLRPVFHRLQDRVRAHVFIAMLAAYLTWHLRKTLAPLTFTDQHPPTPADPVAPATRSASATRKASTRTTQDG